MEAAAPSTGGEEGGAEAADDPGEEDADPTAGDDPDTEGERNGAARGCLVEVKCAIPTFHEALFHSTDGATIPSTSVLCEADAKTYK